MAKSARKTTTQERTAQKDRTAGRGAWPGGAMRAALLAWYRKNRRELPWRETPSLYKTVVSEFMLQQTQVATVLPYFARWMGQYPDFAALAAARGETVLRSWEGLGYYRRARLLHELARAVAPLKEHPKTVAGWRELPGVGGYTAAAIASINFGIPAAVVDGNVVRVLTRLMGDNTLYRDGSRAVKALTPRADAFLNPNEPGDHNQAVMELGALICTRRQPRCGECPLRQWCVAAERGEAEAIPRFAPKVMVKVMVQRLWLERDGAILLHRRAGDARRMAGIFELPAASSLPAIKIEARPMAVNRRTITQHSITEKIYRATGRHIPRRLAPKEEGEFVWVPWTKIPEITLSGPHRRWIEELRAGDKKQS